MSTLRGRLILSHVLPLLVIAPLVGVALVYILETLVVLPNLSEELARQAILAAELAKARQEIWREALPAQAFANRLGGELKLQVMLLDADGRLLASSDPADEALRGRVLALPGTGEAQAGRTYVSFNRAYDPQAEVAEALAPVTDAQGRLVGLVRMTHELTGVYQRFLRLRSLVGAIVAGELLLGAGAGLVLALNLERSLSAVTTAIQETAEGRRAAQIPEQGPREIRALFQAVNLLVIRLRALEEARRRLLAILVHELGRPLGALRAAVHALRHGAGRDRALRAELLAGMEGEIERLQPLLDSLAQLHGQVLGVLELNRCPVVLHDWLRALLPTWRAEALQKGLHWEACVPENLGAVCMDADKMAQAVGNLVSNAIKYTPAGGRVAVTAGQDRAEVWLRVADTGPGVAPEEQALVFDPFFRGSQAGRFPQGLGLGLTLARDLVAAHGGRLVLASQPGQGSNFTLFLPRRLD